MKCSLRQVTQQQLKELPRSGSVSAPCRLQGIELPQDLSCPIPLLQYIVGESLRSRGAIIAGGLARRGIIRHCSFTDVDLDEVEVRRTDISLCSCDKVLIGSRHRARLDRCVFRSCTFSATWFRSIFSRATRFVDCAFNGGGFADVRWNGCSFENVTVTGHVASTNFKECQFVQADFRSATFADTSFLCGIEGLLLPDRPDNFVVAASRLAEVCGKLKGKLSASGFKEFESIARILSVSKYPVMVDRGLFEDLADEDRDTVMNALFAMRH